MSSSTTLHSDQALVEQIARADRQTVEEVYRSCLGPVIAYVTKNSGDEGEARDIFQEGFTVLFNQARSGKLQLTASVSTYLQAICRRLWLKQLRKRGNSGVTFSEQLESKEEESITDAFAQHDKRSLFKEKFNQLGADCQRLMNLFFEGNPMTKIVEVMGFSSVSYAKKRKFQCKEKLVSLIKQDPLFRELSN